MHLMLHPYFSQRISAGTCRRCSHPEPNFRAYLFPSFAVGRQRDHPALAVYKVGLFSIIALSQSLLIGVTASKQYFLLLLQHRKMRVVQRESHRSNEACQRLALLSASMCISRRAVGAALWRRSGHSTRHMAVAKERVKSSRCSSAPPNRRYRSKWWIGGPALADRSSECGHEVELQMEAHTPEGTSLEVVGVLEEVCWGRDRQFGVLRHCANERSTAWRRTTFPVSSHNVT